jgi:leucyl aminopeptidase
MKTAIKIEQNPLNNDYNVVLCYEKLNFSNLNFTKKEQEFVEKSFKNENNSFVKITQIPNTYCFFLIKDKQNNNVTFEGTRKLGNTLYEQLKKDNATSITFIDQSNKSEITYCFLEGLLLSDYHFDKYLTKKNQFELKNIDFVSKNVNKNELNELITLVEATFIARDLVNEPVSFLNAEQLSKEATKFAKKVGVKVEVLNKKKIESLQMGGLLAVNKGSIDPPTFSILEWKPSKHKNKKPFVFVGKGVVYDTGGLSLKPTPNSMDLMKSDMAGAAAVIGAIFAIAKSNLPYHVVGLIPATDNRLSGNAYAPGDVVEMFDKTTVEVLNTDAEGRMILADALSYAKKYNPELVIDLATLTGAAVRAFGTIAIASMGNNPEYHEKLKKSGENTFERLAEMPFWDDYEEMIKSPIADLKNIGGDTAGAITAGKFLEHFTKTKGKSAYPWIHLDIAGPAFITHKDSYRLTGGTGVGVRLLFDFIKNCSK